MRFRDGFCLHVVSLRNNHFHYLGVFWFVTLFVTVALYVYNFYPSMLCINAVFAVCSSVFRHDGIVSQITMAKI